MGHAAAFVHPSSCRSLYRQVTFSDYYVQSCYSALHSFARSVLIIKQFASVTHAARWLQRHHSSSATPQHSGNSSQTALRTQQASDRQRCSSGVRLHAVSQSTSLLQSNLNQTVPLRLLARPYSGSPSPGQPMGASGAPVNYVTITFKMSLLIALLV